MADEKKKTTKKAPAEKAAAEKSAARKRTAKKAPAEKKAAEKKAPKAEKKGGKKDAAKKTAKKEAKKESKKAGGKQPEKKAPKSPAPKPAPIVVRASSKYVRIAPRKARLVADQIRGLHIERARALLQFSPRSAAQDIQKLLDSAAANAENNHDLVADEMRVAEITVDEGPTLRRYRPRALGRATPINKRTSHIAVALSPEEEA
jgi:ribosomal protein L22